MAGTEGREGEEPLNCKKKFDILGEQNRKCTNNLA